MPVNKILALALVLAAALAFAGPDLPVRAQSSVPPTSGAPAAGLGAIDDTMTSLLQKYQIPGGALAVANDGHLVMARGYGYADQDAGTPVQPASLFRIASGSKMFTAAAVLTLVDQGLVSLDAPAFSLLSIQPLPGATVDPRIAAITVRELLQHTAGFDDTNSPDPMRQEDQIATAMGVPAPADCPTIISYMMGKPLDFDPGTKYVYSNFGYCVLGRVIEAASGMSYGDYVQQHVLSSAGISDMVLGHTLQSQRYPNEVSYYDYPGAPLVSSVFADGTMVPAPYGLLSIEGRDANGGWVGSAVDLVKLFTALDGSSGPALLQPATFAQMLARPAPPVAVGTPTYRGLGPEVRPVTGGFNYFKDGDFPGTVSYMQHLANGWDWGVTFNSRPNDLDAFESDLSSQINTALNRVAQPPSGNLFPQFP